MDKLNYCTERMAKYLRHKWNCRNITQKQIESIFTPYLSTLILGGLFADFYYASLID